MEDFQGLTSSYFSSNLKSERKSSANQFFNLNLCNKQQLPQLAVIFSLFSQLDNKDLTFTDTTVT